MVTFRSCFDLNQLQVCVLSWEQYLWNGKEDAGEGQTILDCLSLVKHDQQPERCVRACELAGAHILKVIA